MENLKLISGQLPFDIDHRYIANHERLNRSEYDIILYRPMEN